jgi:RNA polymerase sigma-70 factor (ECF subfamily)
VERQVERHTVDRAGADRSFEELWHRYQRPLTFFVTGLLPRRGAGDVAREAEDAVQEIMLKVYKNLAHYDGRRSMSAWIYTIARNHCTDLRRKRRVLSMSLDDDADGAPPTAAAAAAAAEQRYRTPEQAYLAQEVRRSIDTFMAELGSEDRSVLFLRFFEELPYAEIADVTGRPAGTVRYRVHELKKRLKDYLEDEG